MFYGLGLNLCWCFSLPHVSMGAQNLILYDLMFLYRETVFSVLFSFSILFKYCHHCEGHAPSLWEQALCSPLCLCHLQNSLAVYLFPNDSQSCLHVSGMILASSVLS